MKKVKSLVVAVGIATAASVGFAPSAMAADDVSSYRSALVKQADDSAGAASVLRQFDDLSSAQQKKFVKYATDEDVLKATLSKSAAKTAAGSGEHTTSLASGDVKVSIDGVSSKSKATKAKGKVSTKAAAGTLWDVKTDYTVTQEILGVTVTKLVQEYYYQTQDGNVVSSTSCADSHVNYNAVVALSSSTSHGMWGSHGQCTTNWTGNIVFKGFGIDMGKKQYMEVDGVGLYDGYLVNV